jgi:hypothetical protein
MHFGALRVLNDDIVQAGSGFGMHPHENMEIISIPLAGALEHRCPAQVRPVHAADGPIPAVAHSALSRPA